VVEDQNNKLNWQSADSRVPSVMAPAKLGDRVANGEVSAGDADL
jgi:hypothetical protein